MLSKNSPHNESAMRSYIVVSTKRFEAMVSFYADKPGGSQALFVSGRLRQIVVDWRGPLAYAEGEQEAHVRDALA